MNHTPGPWAVREAEGDELYEVYREAGGELITYAAATTKQRVNANLIAAAPELLAAMKAAVSEISGWDFSTTPDPGDTDFVLECKRIIAKAEGGE